MKLNAVSAQLNR